MINLINTPLGPMVANATSKGICLLEFQNHAPKLRPAQQEQSSLFIPQLEKELHEYFKGDRKKFTVPLDLSGTPFQQSVWQALMNIPYGQTWSYKQQAECLNNPKAIRAVANANSHNPVSIIVPCHRVIGSNGSLTGYAGGLDRKKWLLSLEQNQ